MDRPWGWYRVLFRGRRTQIKLILVRPGQRLSLQRHLHRSELWFVLAGAGDVTCEARVMRCGVGAVARIAAGAVHRVACASAVPLLLVEVQRGPVLEEDDIERLSDDYGRASHGTRQWLCDSERGSQ